MSLEKFSTAIKAHPDGLYLTRIRRTWVLKVPGPQLGDSYANPHGLFAFGLGMNSPDTTRLTGAIVSTLFRGMAPRIEFTFSEVNQLFSAKCSAWKRVYADPDLEKLLQDITIDYTIKDLLIPWNS